MAKIVITDLPFERELSSEELSEIVGGMSAMQLQKRKKEQRWKIEQQNKLQRQQQALALLSNVSKVAHSKNQAFTRKIG